MSGADWNHPTLTDNYDDVLDIHIVGRDVDAITLQKSAPSNLPDGAMAYDRGTDLFKEWDLGGLAFVNKKLSIAGGGTGADNAAQARTNLGLGSMATQDSTSVSITGGSVSGITLNASVITAGTLALARGGTGASLSLGTAGKVLQSDGAAVVFGTDGSQLINLNASNLSSGTVPLARLPSGIGGQVVQGTYATQTTFTSTSFTASGLTVSITPSGTSSRVKLEVAVPLIGGGNELLLLAIYRSIGGGAFSQIHLFGTFGRTVSSFAIEAVGAAVYVDSPSTVSACVYTIYAATTNGASQILFPVHGGNQTKGTIVATEVF